MCSKCNNKAYIIQYGTKKIRELNETKHTLHFTHYTVDKRWQTSGTCVKNDTVKNFEHDTDLYLTKENSLYK